MYCFCWFCCWYHKSRKFQNGFSQPLLQKYDPNLVKLVANVVFFWVSPKSPQWGHHLLNPPHSIVFLCPKNGPKMPISKLLWWPSISHYGVQVWGSKLTPKNGHRSNSKLAIRVTLESCLKNNLILLAEGIILKTMARRKDLDTRISFKRFAAKLDTRVTLQLVCT